MLVDALPPTATLVDVGLRDGLQAVSEFVPTDLKVEILYGLVDAGFTTLEITSFAHPKVLPQFRDAEQVIENAPRRNGVRYKALVPNLRGAERACETAIDEIVVVIPVDEGMARKNQNSTPEQLLQEFDTIVAKAHHAGKTVSAAVATAFFTPCRGPVPASELRSVVDRVVDSGTDSLYLAGTSGMETPAEFETGIAEVKTRHPGVPVGVHLHNRNGLGVLNAVASLAAGADWLEGSFGGLGGDMWFPGDPSVLGNVPMEDVVETFHAMGIRTGIDAARYLEVVRHAEGATGVPSYSFVTRGGTRQELADATWPS